MSPTALTTKASPPGPHQCNCHYLPITPQPPHLLSHQDFSNWGNVVQVRIPNQCTWVEPETLHFQWVPSYADAPGPQATLWRAKVSTSSTQLPIILPSNAISSHSHQLERTSLPVPRNSRKTLLKPSKPTFCQMATHNNGTLNPQESVSLPFSRYLTHRAPTEHQHSPNNVYSEYTFQNTCTFDK